MPRSLLARSMEPLVAISWGIFLVWSVWLAAVWIVGIDQQWLGLPIASPAEWDRGGVGLVEDAPPPRHAELRRAVLILAEHAELAWFALALIQLHLHVIAANGVDTARRWLGIAALGAFLLGVADRARLPAEWMQTGFSKEVLTFTRVLGAKIFGVPLGWVLLWVVLLIAAREAVLRVWGRASHARVAITAAVVVLVTLANLHRIALETRAWWFWHTGNVREGTATPWWFWLFSLLGAWVILSLMRERNVMAAAAQRSAKPLIILVLLNFAALATRLLR